MLCFHSQEKEGTIMFLTKADIGSGFPICRFSKDFIWVQSATDIKNMNCFSDIITLHIMNTFSNEMCILNEELLSADVINTKFCRGEPLSRSTSAIHLQIPIGQDTISFVDNEAYHNFDMTVPKDWSVSKWQKSSSGNHANCSITSAISRMVLDKYECISVQISNIVSLCPPGATYVQISLENVANVTELYKTFHLLKNPAPLNIVEFTAFDPVISVGKKARLSWKTAEKTKGKILPNEFSISEGVAEYVEELTESKTYTLQIENEHDSKKESCTVYVSPPMIRKFEMDISGTQVLWDTEYASKVSADGELCAASGSKQIPVGTAHITLCCDGYLFHTDHTIYPLLFSSVMLECRTYIFSAYTVIRVWWNQQGAVGCKLLVQEPEDHYVLDLSRGRYEYVYLHPSLMPLSNNQLMITFIDSTSASTELFKSANWKDRSAGQTGKTIEPDEI